MRIKKVAAPMAALALTATLTTGAATSADAHHSDGAKKIKTCKGKQLKVSAHMAGTAAGSTYRKVTFRNAGKRCVVRSWPRIIFLHKRGTPVGFFASHPKRRPHIVLRHGQRARVTLQTPNPDNYGPKFCGPYPANRIVTYTSRARGPRSRHVTKLKHPLRVCSIMKGRSSLSRLHKVRRG